MDDNATAAETREEAIKLILDRVNNYSTDAGCINPLTNPEGFVWHTLRLAWSSPENREDTISAYITMIKRQSQEIHKRRQHLYFEFEGVMITDRTKSPCGRFDLTEEESIDLYGAEQKD